MAITIRRTPADQVAPVGAAAGLHGAHAAAMRLDITPVLGLGLSGHGPDTDRAHGAVGRLWVNLLVLDDGGDERVALIAADLMSGSRYLTEKIAALCDRVTGLTAPRLFFAGSHTHRAPGWIWGNRTYDRITATADLAQWDAPFDQGLADQLAARIAGGLVSLCAKFTTEEPGTRATVGYGTGVAVGASWNRSFEAALTERTPPDPDPKPGKKWRRRKPDLSDANVLRWHQFLNGGGPPLIWNATWCVDNDPGPVPDASAEVLTGWAERFGAELADAVRWLFRELSLADAAVLTGVLAAADEDDWRALRDLLQSDKSARKRVRQRDVGPGLRAMYDRYRAGDATLTMDEVMKTLLQPTSSLLDVFIFLLALREFGDGDGRWWRHRRERRGERLLTDSRVHLIAAHHRDSGALIGAFATFGATPAIVGAMQAVYCGDGYAAAVDRLGRSLASGQPAIGIAGGTVGDANLVSPKRDALDIKTHRKDLGELLDVMDGASAAVAAAVQAALNVAKAQPFTDLRLSVAYDEVRPSGATVTALGKPRSLPQDAAFGLSTLAASDLGKSNARYLLTEELLVRYKGGRPYPYDDEPHLPQPRMPRFDERPDVLPIRAIRFSGSGPAPLVLAGLPAEISSLLGAEMARDVVAAVGGGARAVIAGPVGEYVSYFSTVGEFVAQHYEGASNPWGRWSGEWLKAELARVAAGGQVSIGAVADFPTTAGHPARGLQGVKKVGGGVKVPTLGLPSLAAIAAPTLQVDAGGAIVRGAWREVGDPCGRPLWEGPLVELLDAAGQPLRLGGRPIDDAHFPMVLWAEPTAGGALWRFEFRGLAVPPGAAVRARVGLSHKTVLSTP